MPNWCSTVYKIQGQPEEVYGLYERMKRLQEMKEPLKPNGFGTAWLGNLVEDLGVDFNKVQCRGSWDGLCIEEDVLSFYTETAWYRCTEVEDLIREKYPSLSIAFRCEEPGMCIYEKNDSTFFPEEYIIDYEDDDSYYLSESDALNQLSDYFGIDFKDMEEAMILVKESHDKEEGSIWVNKYELVD